MSAYTCVGCSHSYTIYEFAHTGCAGNAIQLTNDFTLVYAVEISKRRADMARHNAEVYGVGSQVEVSTQSSFWN